MDAGELEMGLEPIYTAQGENLLDKEGFVIEGLVDKVKYGQGGSK